MPLARRFSNSSNGSASRRLSLPSSAPSSTAVNPEKVERIMSRRRKTKQQIGLEQRGGDKENDIQEPAVPQSPTPYWKVAKERGNDSPRETRSAKKKKRLSVSRFNFSRPNKDLENKGFMTFSPPNQKENARREKEEFERKEKERADRIKKKRESGQLLVFSPTFSRPAKYKEVAEEEPAPKQQEENLENTEVEIPVPPVVTQHTESKSQMSSFAMSDDRNSERITDELKSLKQTIHQLVEQSKQTDNSRQHQQQLQVLDLETQRQLLRTENLTQVNSKLEQQNDLLNKKIEEIESKNLSERENMHLKTTRLEAELAATNRDTNIQVQGLGEARRNLEIQLDSLRNEKSDLSNKVSDLEAESRDARRALHDSKIMLETLKREFNTEKVAAENDHKSLIEANSELSSNFEQIKLNNESLNATIKSYEDKIQALENDLLPESEEQLQDALKNIQRLEMVEKESQMVIGQYEKEIQEVKAMVKKLKQQKEDERNNFQSLNESTTQAYEKMMADLDGKNIIIEELKENLTSTKESLTAESNRVDKLSDDMEKLKSEMGERIDDLQKSLNESLQALEVSAKEKMELEQRLQKACEEIDKGHNFMEEMLSASKEKSVALEETDKLRMVMQRRITELEQQLQQTTEERNHARERMATFNDREESLFQRLLASDQVRRNLHNRVMQLSGSIRVYVRVRPALACELEVSEKAAKPPTTRGQKRKHNSVNQQESLFHFPGQLAGLDERMAKKSKNGAFGADDPTKNILEVKEPYKDRGGLTDRRKKWTFGFDHIFDPSHGQEDIWEATEPLVQSAIDGFNVTVFAYGQTGSGKTFTMLGEEGNEGIISRAVGKLFDAKTEIEDLSRGGKKVELSVELLEVYNEKVRDLLVSGSGSDGKELSLKLSANEAVGSLVVPVGSQEEVHKILDKAQKRRCVKATASNAVSSRSHMIFTIHFQVASKSGTSRIGKLHVCDLAGSERLGKSNSNEQVGSSLLRETKHINTSLSVLSNVIEKLQVGDATIPYRESKLTYLLQNSLGGNSKTLAIVCCNPLQSHFHESLCSLRFAAKVNKVDLKAVANFSC